MPLKIPVAGFKTTLTARITSTETTIYIDSVVDDAGNNLSGTFGFVIDEGTAYEETIIGTVNAGNSTLTSCLRGISPVTGSTEIVALQFAHRKKATIKITDHPYLISVIRALNGVDQFDADNIMEYDAAPAFTPGSNELATVAYADALAIAGAPDGSETTKGVFEAGTSTEVANGDDTGSTSAPTMVRPSKLAEVIQKGSYLYAADAGANDTYVITLVPALAAYTTGQSIYFVPNTSNTGASTINVNGLGAKNIKKYCNGAISDTETNDLKDTMPCHLIYDGTQFILQTTPATSLTSAAAYEAQQFFDSTNMTGAEAETLTDGSEASTLHVHRVIGSLDKSASDVTVTNTGVETTLITYAVPANTLGTSRAIKVEAPISEFNFGGSSTTMIFRLKYGGTTVATATIDYTTGTNTTGYSGKLEAYLFGTGATNTQEGSLAVNIFGPAATVAAAENFTVGDVGVGTAAVDSTAQQTLLVTVQLTAGVAQELVTIPHYFIH